MMVSADPDGMFVRMVGGDPDGTDEDDNHEDCVWPSTRCAV
jgi:hypothetical protein